MDNHLKDLVALDFFVVPTATFGVLFGLLVVAHRRRRVLHFNVTANPTAEWTARQVIHAFPEETAPRFLVRDRDKIYGERYRRAVEVLGSEDATRCHLSPAGDAPEPRGIQRPERGRVVEFPVVGGLHHRYERVAA